MSITAVLTLYKRPYTLIEQIIALKKQSIPPENIIIWKNYSEGIEMPKIPDNLNKNIIVIESSKNFGVWARFYVGLLVNSMYICVFDDDTIPGKDWFKNCLDTMNTHCGLLGTIGLRFKKGNNYSHYPRIGWDGPNNNVEQVDIVGHSWFFKREWLSYFSIYNPDYDKMLRCGEDIYFSFILQKHGINTYVPPHPISNTDLWGSNSQKAIQYGTDKNAISMTDGTNNFNSALNHFIKLGFKTMINKI